MRTRGKDLAYLVTGVGVVLAHYVVPYSLLKNAGDFTLFTFWSCLVFLWLVVTLSYLRRW